MKRKFIREVHFYKHHYLNFFENLNENAQDKLNWTLEFIVTLPWIPIAYFKKVSGQSGLFEIRTSAGGTEIRVFAILDGLKIIILNGFIKKSRKTPYHEIQKANSIRSEYEKEKGKH